MEANKKIPKSRKKDFKERRSPERTASSRRASERRDQSMPIEFDLRKKERRDVDFEDYSKQKIAERVEYIEKVNDVKLNHISSYSIDPQQIKGNIENFIGVSQIPMGIVGPVKINGDYANGEFFIPLSTTEASLIMTYQLGMQVINLSGGAEVKITKDNVHVSPIFITGSLKESSALKDWVEQNFDQIKIEAEKTTKFGKLISINPRIKWNKLILVFNYTTGDAAGQNMISIATDFACEYIYNKTGYKFYLKSNFSSDKKVSWYNYLNGYGKSVQACVMIPKKVARRYLKAEPEEMNYYYKNCVIESSNDAGAVGIQGHFANGLAALFIACGQDVAHIVNSHMGSITHELTEEGGLFSGVQLSSLVIGTKGGGTHFGTNKEALNLLGCFGSNKVKKFAEIAAVVALAGEIAIAAALTNGTFAKGHNKYRSK